MGLGLFKGKKADEIDSSAMSTAADQIGSPSTSTAVQEESERGVHVTYNLRKRKHEDAQDYKEQITTSTSSKQLQTLGKKKRKDQQSTALVRQTRTRPTKLSGKKVQQPRTPAVQTSPKLSTNQRKRVRTKEVQKNSTFSEFKERLQKRIPRRGKDANKKNKMDLKIRKNSKNPSKPNSFIKSKNNLKSSKGPAEDLQKTSKSSKATRRTTQTTGSNSKREMPLNSSQNGQAGSCKKPKTSRKLIFEDKIAAKTETKMSSNQDELEFGEMFKKELEIKAHINVGINKSIHGICVTNDNLIWVNYLGNSVKLFDAAGNILRSVDLERNPVFNCCTSNGDLLFTQGYAGGARAEVILVPKEGELRVLADLTSYAQNLCGILCQEETIFIVGYRKARKSSVKYFVMKLNINGEFEGSYETKPETVNINHIISQLDRLYAISTHGFSLLPVENDKVSTKVINTNVLNSIKLSNVYSASACVDNFGNVLMGSGSNIHVLDPSLQRLHKINSDIPDEIISTAVDHQNHLWIGTRDGNLYIAKYMQ